MLNKIDLCSDKSKLMATIARLNAAHPFSATVPVSVTEADGIDLVEQEVMALAQPAPHYFPDEKFTDQPERVLAAEMIREKILNLLRDEVPHGIAVSIERMKERDDKDLLDIDATIYCERESHKGILIGKNGTMLRKIATLARKDLERFFYIQVNLQCWVKVKEDWRNKEGLIHNFGLDNPYLYMGKTINKPNYSRSGQSGVTCLFVLSRINCTIPEILSLSEETGGT